MKALMLSCHKATELIEKNAVAKLSIMERIRLRVHKSMCDACTSYEKQSKLIDKILHKHIDPESVEDIAIQENRDLKEKIRAKL